MDAHPLDKAAEAAYVVWAMQSLDTPCVNWADLPATERETWRMVADAVLMTSSA